MVAACADRGLFDPTGAVRGVGAWTDDDGVPGSVAADGGQIATDGSTGAKNATVSIDHPGGVLWVAAFNQGAAVTPATLRFVSGGPMGPAQIGYVTQPTSQTTFVFDATITGAPGASPAFGGVSGSSINPPRVSVRYA